MAHRHAFTTYPGATLIEKAHNYLLSTKEGQGMPPDFRVSAAVALVAAKAPTESAAESMLNGEDDSFMFETRRPLTTTTTTKGNPMRHIFHTYPGATTLDKAKAYLSTRRDYQGLDAAGQERLARILASGQQTSEADKANSMLAKLRSMLEGEDESFLKLVEGAVAEDADAVQAMFEKVAATIGDVKKTGKGEKAADVTEKVAASAGRNHIERAENYLLATVPGFQGHDRYRRLMAANAFARELGTGDVARARIAMTAALQGEGA